MSQKRTRNRVRSMGNSSHNMSLRKSPSKSALKMKTNDFKFHDPFLEEDTNGLILNDIFIPEEIVLLILTYLNPDNALKVTLVCKKWCNLVKSWQFWGDKYLREYNKHPKKLPWYVYYELMSSNLFDRNLLKNTCGESGYDHWKIVKNYGDEFRIENPPVGANPLPAEIPDFNGHTSCFATSFYECNKLQVVSFKNNNLMRLIMDQFKPNIYASEWVASRFDCGCVYTLCVRLDGENGEENTIFEDNTVIKFPQWAEPTWQKAEITITCTYGDGVCEIVFMHEGKDTQFWKGHYGSKMSGGVLKILFDSIEPLQDPMDENNL